MTRFGRMPRFLVCMGAAAAIALGCEAEDEECFELTGGLSQVTSDTLTDRHLEPVMTPDGTQAIFSTDYFGIVGGNEERRDIAIIDLPAAGEVRSPVPDLLDVGNAKILAWGNQPLENGSNADFDERTKAQPAAHPDGQRIAAVISVQIGLSSLDRIYIATLERGAATGTAVPVSNVTLLDDVDLAGSANNRWYRYRTPAFHPDPASEWIAYARWYETPGDQETGVADSVQAQAIFAHNLGTGQTVQVTPGASVESSPSWSPDGSRITFESRRSGVMEVWTVAFDPTFPERLSDDPASPDFRVVQMTRLTATPDGSPIEAQSFDPTWLRSGRIAFVSTRRAPCTSYRDRNLWSMNSDGSDVKPIFFSRTDDHFPAFDPSGGNTVVFSSGINPVEDFEGAKEDLWVLRGF